jgi:hypothetical protein
LALFLPEIQSADTLWSRPKDVQHFVEGYATGITVPSLYHFVQRKSKSTNPIVVLTGTGIVEQGSHEMLLRQNGKSHHPNLFTGRCSDGFWAAVIIFSSESNRYSNCATNNTR